MLDVICRLVCDQGVLHLTIRAVGEALQKSSSQGPRPDIADSLLPICTCD